MCILLPYIYCQDYGIMALIICAFCHTLNIYAQLSSWALCQMFCLNLHLLGTSLGIQAVMLRRGSAYAHPRMTLHRLPARRYLRKANVRAHLLFLL